MAEAIVGIIIVFLVFLPLGLGLVGMYRVIYPYARGRRGTARELLACVGWFLLFGLIVALLLPSIGAAPEAGRRSQCRNNLNAILQAMRNYHQQYDCLPPAHTSDKTGRPLHSWRVLLLPYLDQGALYRRLRLDEPYDSPRNRELAETCPAVYQCPSDDGGSGETNYVMLLGPRTISNGPNSTRLKDIADGPANTIAVVETYGSGIRWYEPRDLRVDEMSFKINDWEYIGIASRHPGGATVALADGTVRLLSEQVEPRGIEALTTINGGEDVSGLVR